MKQTFLIIFITSALILTGYSSSDACGGDCGCGTGKIKDQESNKNSAAIEVGNKLCPVSGQEVGSMGPAVKHEYHGKVYNLCCAGCVKTFNNDPQKYIEKIKAMTPEAPAEDACGESEDCHG